jgi:hypothetical protein
MNEDGMGTYNPFDDGAGFLDERRLFPSLANPLSGQAVSSGRGAANALIQNNDLS